MENVTVNYLSEIPHLAQILTGFHFLNEIGEYNVTFNNSIKKKNPEVSYPGSIEVIYKGKKIIYDLDDGYQKIDGIRYLLSDCDYYFKRSFSDEKNNKYFSDFVDKMYPLGFNYHVSYEGNPINEQISARDRLKKLLGYKTSEYFTPEIFERKEEKNDGNIRILFYTRLWPEEDVASDKLKKERAYINEMRIEIIRKLREKYGKNFSGGIQHSKLALSMCPDLILSPNKSNRCNYLKRLHKSDICIGSMGLHESIGWKTGEYVAASKAIVNETLRYSVPGNFEEGVNYLAFNTTQECIDAVDRLVNNPDLLNSMKDNNNEYYDKYLKPEVLVKNTLNIVKSQI